MTDYTKPINKKNTPIANFVESYIERYEENYTVNIQNSKKMGY